MEMRSAKYQPKKKVHTVLILSMLIASCAAFAQPANKKYIIQDGKMLIEISKQLDEASLDSFILKFDLFDLDLKQFIKTNSADSLKKLGWKLEKNNREAFVISKLLRGVENFNNPADKIIYLDKDASLSERFPSENHQIKYGYNSFKKKFPFHVKDSFVTFYLRNNRNAQKVMLAGSFNDWDPGILAMTQTDSGWIAVVKLSPGKYWYKFIIDGNWSVDRDNARVENDGMGNDNSIFYKSNIVFKLNGFDNAKKICLAGTFNNWKPRELQMIKTSSGWELPLYLSAGTHTYRFVVDGQWITDPQNDDRLPNEFNDFNSVISVGKPHIFRLTGYTNAKKVMLAGSFNNWQEHELLMTKTSTGWELPYSLGPGNYEYRYKVDDKWITNPERPLSPASKENQGNAYVIINPNYTFRLKGFNQVNTVFLAGDFNNWSPNIYAMKRDGEDWILDVHLSTGKHLYKFVADGKWIIDPGNNLWEQNELGTGNSVIWYKR